MKHGRGLTVRLAATAGRLGVKTAKTKAFYNNQIIGTVFAYIENRSGELCSFDKTVKGVVAVGGGRPG